MKMFAMCPVARIVWFFGAVSGLAVPVKAAEPAAVEILARRNSCLECHAVEKNVVGPSWRAVAARSRSEPQARQALAAAIKSGSKGKWTEISRGVPMPPYARTLSDAEIQRLVDWLLSF